MAQVAMLLVGVLVQAVEALAVWGGRDALTRPVGG